MGNLEKLLTTTPLFLPSISLGVGILLSTYNGIGLNFGVVLILLSVIIYLALTYLKRNPVSFYKIRSYHYLWLSLSFIGLGVITYDLHAPVLNFESDKIENCHITGVIESITPSNTGDKLILKVVGLKDNKGHKISCNNLKVKISSSPASYETGNLVSVKTNLRKVRDSENSFRGGYANYLKNKGILMESVSNVKVSKLNSHNYDRLGRISLIIRDDIIRGIEHTRLNKKTQQFLITILLGDKEYIDPEMRTAFAGAGVSHILALSGMHVGIIASILMFLFFPLCLLGKYKWRYIAIIIALWGYCFVTGMQPSTLRAVIMCSFALIGIVLERKNSVFNALCAALLLILVFAPMDIFDMGFQMSFICVFTIICFSKTLKALPQRKHPLLFKFLNLIFITLVASFGTWILTAYYFNILPTSFFLSNLFLIPQLPIFIVICLSYFALSAIGLPVDLLSKIIDGWLKILFDCISNFSSDSVVSIDIPFESLIFWFIGIILFALYLHYNRHKLVLYSSIVAFGFSLLFIPLFPPEFKDNDYIVTNNYRDIKINILNKGVETPYRMERNSTSTLHAGQHKIVVIDSDIDNYDILDEAEAIILASGFKGDINELAQNIGNSIVIMHSSIRRKKEHEYISILRNKGKTHHSLRNDGPYKNYK